jgi:hypothetical protein
LVVKTARKQPALVLFQSQATTEPRFSDSEIPYDEPAGVRSQLATSRAEALKARKF